jgi:hypothetical protein
MEVLPTALVWLADAPLFIDADHVSRFYDAVVRPESRQGTVDLAISEETQDAIRGKLNLEGSLTTTEKLATLLTPIFAFLKPTIRTEATGDVERQRTSSESSSVQLLPISTPQRDLVLSTLHYLVNHPDRLFFPNEEGWKAAEVISAVPRAIAFFDLPGMEEAKKLGRPVTKLIPTAAEFENGRIEQIYKNLRFTDEEIPKYP